MLSPKAERTHFTGQPMNSSAIRLWTQSIFSMTLTAFPAHQSRLFIGTNSVQTPEEESSKTGFFSSAASRACETAPVKRKQQPCQLQMPGMAIFPNMAFQFLCRTHPIFGLKTHFRMDASTLTLRMFLGPG